MHLIKHIITTEWIQPQGLKHLFASFHNIGVFLYRNKQPKEVILFFILSLYDLLMSLFQYLVFVPGSFHTIVLSLNFFSLELHCDFVDGNNIILVLIGYLLPLCECVLFQM